MKKEKSKNISSWKELTTFLEGINPFRKTIILSGYINKINKDGRATIQTVVFRTIDVETLQEIELKETPKKNGRKKSKKGI